MSVFEQVGDFSPCECANCGMRFPETDSLNPEDEDDDESMKSPHLKIMTFSIDVNDEEYTIEVCEALIEIYRLYWVEELSTVEGSRLKNKLILCYNCGVIFAQLCKYYYDFNFLRKANSVITESQRKIEDMLEKMKEAEMEELQSKSNPQSPQVGEEEGSDEIQFIQEFERCNPPNLSNPPVADGLHPLDNQSGSSNPILANLLESPPKVQLTSKSEETPPPVCDPTPLNSNPMTNFYNNPLVQLSLFSQLRLGQFGNVGSSFPNIPGGSCLVTLPGPTDQTVFALPVPTALLHLDSNLTGISTNFNRIQPTASPTTPQPLYGGNAGGGSFITDNTRILPSRPTASSLLSQRGSSTIQAPVAPFVPQPTSSQSLLKSNNNRFNAESTYNSLLRTTVSPYPSGTNANMTVRLNLASGRPHLASLTMKPPPAQVGSNQPSGSNHPQGSNQPLGSNQSLGSNQPAGSNQPDPPAAPESDRFRQARPVETLFQRRIAPAISPAVPSSPKATTNPLMSLNTQVKQFPVIQPRLVSSVIVQAPQSEITDSSSVNITLHQQTTPPLVPQLGASTSTAPTDVSSPPTDKGPAKGRNKLSLLMVPPSCDVCGQTFNTRRGLSLHRFKEHFRDRGFQCTWCDNKFFATKRSYHAHMSAKHGIPAKPPDVEKTPAAPTSSEAIGQDSTRSSNDSNSQEGSKGVQLQAKESLTENPGGNDKNSSKDTEDAPASTFKLPSEIKVEREDVGMNKRHAVLLQAQPEEELGDPSELLSPCSPVITVQKGKTYQLDGSRFWNKDVDAFPMKCVDCSVICSTFTDLHEHRMSAHPVDDPFKCHICKLTLATAHSFNLHMLKHAEEQLREMEAKCRLPQSIRPNLSKSPVECEFCHKTFKSNSELGKHISRMHEFQKVRIHRVSLSASEGDSTEVQKEELKSKTKKGGKCSKGTSKKSSNGSSRASKTGRALYSEKSNRNQIEFKCSDCTDVYPTATSLGEHRTAAHPDVDTFKCHICGKIVSRANSLSDHVKRHTGLRPYRCKNCGNTFKTAGDARQHHFAVHGHGAIEGKGKKQKAANNHDSEGVPSWRSDGDNSTYTLAEERPDEEDKDEGEDIEYEEDEEEEEDEDEDYVHFPSASLIEVNLSDTGSDSYHMEDVEMFD